MPFVGAGELERPKDSSVGDNNDVVTDVSPLRTIFPPIILDD